MAIDAAITSGLSIWRYGFSSAASTSMPLARASSSARSSRLTISWSRRLGASSLRKKNARIDTTTPKTPQTTKCVRQSVASLRLLICTATASEPSTGPSVQNPMADARPSCGLKSRTSAGVATSTMPSTKPTTM